MSQRGMDAKLKLSRNQSRKVESIKPRLNGMLGKEYNAIMYYDYIYTRMYYEGIN